MYDPQVPHFLQIDILAETNRRFSPHTYGKNNPIRFIDPDGMEDQEAQNNGYSYSNGYQMVDSRFETGSVTHSGAFQTNGSEGEENPIELQFDQNGNYKGAVDDGKKEYSGAIVDDKGNTIKHFELNDQRDGNLIIQGKIKLDVSFQSLINYYMKQAGINGEKNILTRYFYAGYNSLQGESMDFLQYLANYSKSENVIYLAGSTAYNTYDAGNFLWGNAMQRLGFDYGSVKIGSEANGFFNSKRQNGQGYGVTWGGDSIEDQRAIINGYFWNRFNK